MIVLQKDTDAFQYVSERNRARQYDFLRTAFEVSTKIDDFPIDRQFLCDLNFYAVQYLSEQPGQYRVHYNVTVGAHSPPAWEEVEHLMNRFWNNLNRLWDRMTALECAAFALWSVNHIHPFAEGNGRSARSLCYFIMCKKIGDWLPGSLTVTEQIRIHHRERYCEILGRMDQSIDSDGLTDLREMVAFLEELLLAQLRSVT